MQEGSLLYFPEFYFKNGAKAKPKYFLVLACHPSGSLLLASLPSSQDFIPAHEPFSHGCLEMAEQQVSCYRFAPHHPVLDNDWAFPKPTFLYGQQLDEFQADALSDMYREEKSDFEWKGMLTAVELQAVKACFMASGVVKRRYKRMLSDNFS